MPFERVNNVSMHPDAALFLGNADWVADPHWLQQAGIDIIWCAVDPESRYYDQLSERRELLKQRFGDDLYMWNFSPHYSAQEGVGEEWNFANVVGEHLYRGHRVVVHCAQAEYRGPAAAAWFCMVACGMSFPEAAATASQHPSQRLAGFNQMVWLQQTAARHRARPAFRWAGMVQDERRGAARPAKGPQRRGAAEAEATGEPEEPAANAASDAAAADAAMGDQASEETHNPTQYRVPFVVVFVTHTHVAHYVPVQPTYCSSVVSLLTLTPCQFVEHVRPSRTLRMSPSRPRGGHQEVHQGGDGQGSGASCSP